MRTVPIREIHEIEFSSRCNLACRYCPHPKLKRVKEDMTPEVFQLVLEHLRYFVRQGTQTEVSLTGLGEAILHPEFVPMLREVRGVVGDRKIVMATNGVAMTQALADELTRQRVIVYVSTHRPEKAGPAYEMLAFAGCVIGINSAFVDSAFNWAGQVKWHVTAPVSACNYLARGWSVVRQCGSVDACCLDAHDLHPIGSVFDELGSLVTHVTPLCADCHMHIPVEFQADITQKFYAAARAAAVNQ